MPAGQRRAKGASGLAPARSLARLVWLYHRHGANPMQLQN
ncbi:NifH [Ahrensia sp. R2A130]|nr:NifH [Ahrensia sp. R2A130]